MAEYIQQLERTLDTELKSIQNYADVMMGHDIPSDEEDEIPPPLQTSPKTDSDSNDKDKILQ